jgi:hypothetical protein
MVGRITIRQSVRNFALQAHSKPVAFNPVAIAMIVANETARISGLTVAQALTAPPTPCHHDSAILDKRLRLRLDPIVPTRMGRLNV